MRDWKRTAALKGGEFGCRASVPPRQSSVSHNGNRVEVAEGLRGWSECAGHGGGLEDSRNSTPGSPVFNYIKRVLDSIQLAFRKREL